MTRPQWTWLLFGLCLLLAGGAMAWVTQTSLALEAKQHELARQAAIEERVRLVLWRMESQLGPLLAREVSVTHLAQRDDVALAVAADTPSVPELVADRFSFPRSQATPSATAQTESPGKAVDASPQAQQPMQMRQGARAEGQALPVDAAWLRAQLPRASEAITLAWRSNVDTPPEPEQLASKKGGGKISKGDYANRAKVSVQNWNQNQVVFLPPTVSESASHMPGAAHGLWDGSTLHVAWQASDAMTNAATIEGFTVEWSALNAWLLNAGEDLLPEAKLAPRLPDAPVAAERSLVALPIELAPGPLPADAIDASSSPTGFVLTVAWLAFALAAIAIAILLYLAMDLSARRAAFVSAVTHELRTPLTTFRLYTELLESGMVPDESRRQQYLSTLRVEAERLTHMVENVLAYARLERGRAADLPETLNACDLIESLARQLQPHVATAGMRIELEPCADREQAVVKASPTSIEQVLTNLVDNACKYAKSAEDNRIHLAVTIVGQQVVFSVTDHGPGMTGSSRRWQPFQKSAEAAAESAPGIGLGLALSRRLAQQMGGTLQSVDQATAGARLELALPRLH